MAADTAKVTAKATAKATEVDMAADMEVMTKAVKSKLSIIF